MAFANVEDLEKRWRELSEEERVKADELLQDASAFLETLLVRSGIDIDPDNEVQARNLKAVSCAIVHRIIGTEDNMYGITQFSKTAGVFTQSGTAANPHGDMYLTAQEKLLLGLPASGKRGKMHFMRGAIHTREGEMVNGW